MPSNSNTNYLDQFYSASRQLKNVVDAIKANQNSAVITQLKITNQNMTDDIIMTGAADSNSPAQVLTAWQGYTDATVYFL